MLTLLILLLGAIWHFMPRSTAVMEFPFNPTIRAYCEKAMRGGHPELSKLRIKPFPATDLVEITASGFNREDVRKRRDAAVAFLHEKAREEEERIQRAELKKRDDEWKKMTPEERLAEISKPITIRCGISTGTWTVHALDESGW